MDKVDKVIEWVDENVDEDVFGIAGLSVLAIASGLLGGRIGYRMGYNKGACVGAKSIASCIPQIVKECAQAGCSAARHAVIDPKAFSESDYAAYFFCDTRVHRIRMFVHDLMKAERYK